MTDSKTTVIDALNLAALRVTGDNLQAKVDRRRRIQELKAAVMIGGEVMPGRQELSDALGNPDDAGIRGALDDLTGQKEGE
jgi:hypothetical protein